MDKVHNKSTIIWIVTSILYAASILLFFTIGYFFLNEIYFVKKIYYFSGVIISAYLVIIFIKYPIFRRNHIYLLEDENLYIKKGFLIIQESNVPMKRIQHVDIQQSFVSRFYNLYRVNIYTAGDSHNISFITKNKAQLIKDEIIKYLNDMDVVDNE